MFDRLFNPKTIAVVGASDRRDSLGWKAFQFARRHSPNADVYPVNPSRPDLGVEVFDTLDGIPSPSVDVAFVIVPAAAIPSVIEATHKIDVGFMIVASSGFGEAGRPELEQRLVTGTPRQTRVIGPNCNGLWNGRVGLCLGFNGAHDLDIESANIGVVAQTGAMLGSVIKLLDELGVGVGPAISTGNEAEVSMEELASYMIERPDVRVLGLMIDGVRDLTKFSNVIKAADEHDKDVICLRFGTSERGKRAAELHSARMASRRGAINLWLDRAGVQWTSDFEAFVLGLALAASPNHDSTGGIFGMSSSGAGAAMLADLFAQSSANLMDLPSDLSSDITRRMDFGRAANPLDLTGQAVDQAWSESLLEAIASHGAVGACVGLLSVLPTRPDGSAPLVEALSKAARESRTPFVVYAPCLMSESQFERMRESGILVARSGYGLVEGIRVSSRVGKQQHDVKWIDEYLHSRLIPKGESETSRGFGMSGRDYRILLQKDSERALENTRLVFPSSVAIDTPQDLEMSWEELSSGGDRWVIKLMDEQALHKSDHGGVILDVSDKMSIRRGLEHLSGLPVTTESSRYLIQEMVPLDYELFLGIVVDRYVGPMVILGEGGTDVERMSRTEQFVPPVTDSQLVQSMRRLGIAWRLESEVGSGSLSRVCEDLKNWIDDLVRVCGRESNIRSIDLNPVGVTSSSELIAVDVRIEFASNDW